MSAAVLSPSPVMGSPESQGPQTPASQDALLLQNSPLGQGTNGKPLNICSVCRAPSENFHLNYGVSTCLSCRAFFRRTVQKNNYPKLKCKAAGQCEINEESRRGCRKCRFDACLRAGMQESQVMSEDTKRVRFRRVFKKIEKDLKDVGITVDEDNKIHLPPELEAAKIAQAAAVSIVKKKGRKEKPKDNTLKLTYKKKRNSSGGNGNSTLISSILPKVNGLELDIISNASRKSSTEETAREDFQFSENHSLNDFVKKEEPVDVEVEPVQNETGLPEVLDDDLLLQYLDQPEPHSILPELDHVEEEQPTPSLASSIDASPQNIYQQQHSLSVESGSASPDVEEALRQLFNESPNNQSFQPTQQLQEANSKGVVEQKVANIIQSWNWAVGQHPVHPRFVPSFLHFLQFKQGLHKQQLRQHFGVLVSIFHSFAKCHPRFASLPLQDRELLLKRNCHMLATCVLGHGFGSFSGIEQVMWLLLGQSRYVQQPTMLFLAPMPFAKFNERLGLLSQGDQDLIQRNLLKVRQFNLPCQWLGLLVYACLFHTDPRSLHLFRDPGRIRTGAFEAQLLFNEALGGSNNPIQWHQPGMAPDLPDLSQFLDLLSSTSDVLQRIDWAEESSSSALAMPIDQGFTETEEMALSMDFSKIQEALDSISFGNEIVEELAMANYDVPLSKGFMAKCGAIWQQRFMRILKSFSEFQGLNEADQILCVNRVTIPVFAIITLWSEYMASPAEQQEFSLGASDKAYYRFKYNHCIGAFGEMRPFTLEGANSNSRIFDPNLMKEFVGVKSALKDFLTDRETLNLLILIALFNPVVNLLEMSPENQLVCSQVAKISHQYHVLLRKRAGARGIHSSERLDIGFGQIKELNRIMTLLCTSMG